MIKKAILSLVVALAFVGCSATLPVQTGGLLVKNSGKKVSASVKHTDVLGFSPIPVEKLDQVLTKLQGECGGSKVTGVTTIQKTRFFVLAFVHEFEASGYCAD